MFCNHCGGEISEGDRYCTHCGQQVSTANVKSEQLDPTELVVAKLQKRKVWWMPIAATFVAVLAIGGMNLYEKKVNSSVATYLQKGEALALEGKFQEAIPVFEQGLSLRPKHETIKADLSWAKQGQKIVDQLSKANEQLKQKQYGKAQALIEAATKDAGVFHAPLGDVIHKKVTHQKNALTIAQVKHEMANKKTIEEVAPLLLKLEPIESPEAKEAASEVQTKLVEITLAQAHDYLKNKQFSSALSTVDQALSYVAENSKLLAYKKDIAKQQVEFEQQQQTRIEQAMLAAAKEDEKNRTNAVEVLTTNGSLSEWGGFTVKGEVRNIATRNISMIEVYYSVYDISGQEMDQGSTFVYPYYLEPGETGMFESTVYGNEDGKSFKITNITWYLE
ncbi:hypothetical protein EV586_102610 [Tumebacillus sp. BK434]|uniref:FxLYD domain-containing protein n=1 Tax=Tumebacillus sp. BK434 TaxID=2512169 RepID=UPI00104B1956|nr:FxLYD domain-containing protein [Tumebacillus sp. BK434]TCP58158.1 hypothetical protein EV586_102610 [Tumebacillus sp. BK434]